MLRNLAINLTLAAGLLAPLSGPAAAQPAEMVVAAAGRPLPLMVETTLRPDCSVGPAAVTTVIETPAHGQLTVRQGMLRRQGLECPASAGYVLIYIPEPGFLGMDEVAVDVEQGGVVVRRIFSITVHPAPDEPAARGDVV